MQQAFIPSVWSTWTQSPRVTEPCSPVASAPVPLWDSVLVHLRVQRVPALTQGTPTVPPSAGKAAQVPTPPDLLWE